MAAILCRVFFIEPCKALGRCLNGCCECCGDVCDEIGKCCNYVCDLFERPFSGCLFLSVGLNLGAVIWSLLSLTDGTYDKDDCDDSASTMNIYLILLIILAILNGLFAYYIFYTMNTDEMRQLYDPYYQQQNNNNNSNVSNETIGTKAWDFFKNNPYFAGYICFVFVPTMVIVSLSMGARCPNSTKSDGLYFSSLFIIIFIVAGILIMASYIFIEAMKTASQECCWWLIPCAWPCLIIGVLVNLFEPPQSQHAPATRQDYVDQRNRPVRGPKNQKPQQQRAVAQPVAQPLVAVAVVPANPQPVETPANPFRPGIQPHYTNSGPSAPPQPVASAPVASAPVQSGTYNPQPAAQPVVVHYNQSQPQPGQPGQQDPNGSAAMDVAKAGGALAVKGGKKAIGLMARGLNKLNNKLNENEPAAPANGQHGGTGYEGAEGQGPR